MAGVGNLHVLLFGAYVGGSDVIGVGNGVHDFLHRYGIVHLVATNFVYDGDDIENGGLFAGQIGIGHELVEHALDLAYVGLDLICDALSHGVGHLKIKLFGLFADDRNPGFVVGLLNVGKKSHFKALTKALGEGVYFLWGAVGGRHDLLSGLVKGIEGVEKFGLGRILAGDKLNVVHKKHIGVAEFLAEIRCAARMDGVDYLVCKGLALGIDYVKSGIVLGNIVFNGVDPGVRISLIPRPVVLTGQGYNGLLYP